MRGLISQERGNKEREGRRKNEEGGVLFISRLMSFPLSNITRWQSCSKGNDRRIRKQVTVKEEWELGTCIPHTRDASQRKIKKNRGEV